MIAWGPPALASRIVLWFLAVLICLFLAMKVAQLWDEYPDKPVQDALGVTPASPWSNVDKVGYGMLRRLDDVNFWILVSLLVASRGINVVGDRLRKPSDGKTEHSFLSSYRCIYAYLIAAYFIGFYLLGMKTLQETFWSGLSGLDRWIQCCEGSVNILVFIIAAGSLDTAFGLVRVIRSRVDRATQVEKQNIRAGVQTLLGAALLPIVGAAAFSAIGGYLSSRIAVPLPLTDRLTRAIVEITVFAIPFVALFCYAMHSLQDSIYLGLKIFPDWVEIRLKDDNVH